MKDFIAALFTKLVAASCLLLTSQLHAGYHLTFNDEFNSYNSTRWSTADFWGMRNNGGDYQAQWFCDPNYAPSGFTAYNPFISSGSGTLTIQARPTPAGKYSYGLPYVSGQLTTAHRHTQRYGYYELRAKLPPGKGLWPRFWLLTDDGAWPGEYDIFEVLGKENPVTVHQTTHYRDAASSHGVDGFTYTGINPVDGNFHTYGFLWTPETVTWYVDGVPTFTQPNRINIPMYALIDLTVGNDPNNWWPGNPDATTPWPANMELEYFRVYSNDSSIPSITPDVGYSPSVIPDGNTVEVTPTTTVVPAGWAAGPVGTPELPGSSAWNSTTGEWMIKGAGYGIGGYGEYFQFASAPLSGNGGVVATLQNTTFINSNSVTAGVMIRESTAANSRQISLLHVANASVSPNTSSLVLMSRTTAGALASTLVTVPNIQTPVKLRIVRNSNSFTAAYSSDDGVSWIPVGTPQTITMATSARAGLAIGGNQNNYLRLSRSIFSNVSVGPIAPLVSSPASKVQTGQTLACSASLVDLATGNASPMASPTWSVASGGGTIDANGVYTAPALIGTGTAIIKAVSGSYTATKTITITLPSPWSFPIMVNAPPGNAGALSGAWTVVGGGTGISTASTEDSFQFISAPIYGDHSLVVKVDGSTGPQAGLVMRDSIIASSTRPGVKSRYAGIWRTPTGLEWATRETNGGAAVSRTKLTSSTMPIWLRLSRSASGSGTYLFTASYSTNGSTWTTLGTTRTFAMDVSAFSGLAVASGSLTSTTTATFSELAASSGPPTVLTPATATPVIDSTTDLSVLGADDAGEAALTYTWSATGPAPVTFSINGTNESKNTTATFTRSGTYNIIATITDGTSLSVLSSVAVNVAASLTTLAITPTAATVGVDGTQQFTASGTDQYGQIVTASPTWSVTSGGGTINATGLYTAPATVGTGSAVVTAASGTLSAMGTVTIIPSTALPTPWTAADIFATPAGSSAFTGTEWSVTGGGSAGDQYGLSGTGINGSRYSESFHFVSQPVSGDGTLVAKLIDPVSAAQAGLMFRSTTDKSSLCTSLIYSTQFTPSGLAWMSRTSTGGYNLLHATGISITFPVWLKLVRAGNNVTAFRSTNGTTWTQIGGSQTVPMATNYLAGLAVSSGNATTVSTARFSDLVYTPTPNTPPTVATPAAGNPATVTGATSNLSVLGTDYSGEAPLTYTWTANGPASVTYSVNGTNASKNTTASFSQAGSYTLTATITDAGGLSTTSSTVITIAQTTTGVSLTPDTTKIVAGKTQQLIASAYDQFGAPMTNQPTIAWSVFSGSGSITDSGVYTAPAATVSETAVVQASALSFFDRSTLTIAPHVALPSPWVETGISATPTGEASTINGDWTVSAGGSGILWSTYTDSFHFVSRPCNGDGSAVVRLIDPGSASEAGLMFRESNNEDAPFAGILYTTQGTTPGLAWITREASGAFSTLQTSTIPISGPVWLKLSRMGDTFSAFYSSDGVAWLPLSPPRTFSMSPSALLGLAVSGGNPNTNATATFSDLSINLAPTVATPAAAAPLVGKSTALSILGADDADESGLIYIWSSTGPADVSFSTNASNASKNTTATFNAAGQYTLKATIRDAGNLTTSSSVTVEVNQSLASVSLTPSSPSILASATLQFDATAIDQFGGAMATQPTFTWSVLSGGGTISNTGLFTAPAATVAGSSVVQALAGSSYGTSTISVIPPSTLPTPWTSADISATPAGDSSETNGTWTVKGGGSGLMWSIYSDSFRYVSRPYTGNGTAIVRLTDRGAATQAGLMFRDSTNNNARYAGIFYTTQGATPGLAWITREGATGDFTSLRTPTVPVSIPVWLKLTRVGNTFTAAYSSDGIVWTQVGPARTFTMNASALVGLAVSSGSTSSTATATFSDLSITPSPTVATTLTATPNPMNGNTAALAILGADDTGEAALKYTWSATGPAPVAFSANGTNSAKTATAIFTTVGTYNLLARITNAQGLSVTNSLTITVNGLFTTATKVGTFNPTPAASVNSNGNYTVTGAGTLAVSATTDNFYYYNLQVTGDADLIGRVFSMSNTSNTALGGLMVRGATTNNAVFSGVFTTAASGIQALARTSTPANSIGNTVVGPTRPYWLKVSRRGSTFSTYSSSDGVTWALARTDTISAMPSTAYYGLVAARNSNNSTNAVVFDNVSLQMVGPPTIAIPASTSPTAITGTTTSLSVLGADDSGESNLTYNWSTSGTPPAAVNFSINGNGPAKTTTATFQKPGNYTFLVTVSDSGGSSTTSSVSATVVQTPATISVTPALTNIAPGGTQQIAATAYDQFATAISDQPAMAWSLASGIGTINASGFYTAPAAAGSANVRAAFGSISGTASFTISNASPTVAAAASATPATSTTLLLGVLGDDDAGESGLTYNWANIGTPPAAVSFSTNGSNAAKTTTTTFTKAGIYDFRATIMDGSGATVTSDVSVTVSQALTSLSVSPGTATVAIGSSQTFIPTALDQFGQAMACSVAFSVNGGGTVNSSGVFIAATAGQAFQLTASSGATSTTASIRVNSLLDSWLDTYPSLKESDRTSSADPDGDGVCNLLEFALGGVPDNAANRGCHIAGLEDTNSNGQQELTLTLAVRNTGGSPTFGASAGGLQSTVIDGVKYTIQGSASLIFPSGTVSEVQVPTAMPPLPSGYEYRRFRLVDSEGLSGKGFLRVQIEPTQ
jgi:beta-glucanase (GH16 family)/regulation of enolase protein 1 (concanavalin A-like superfamily)